jgi:hypothetical protein
MAEPQHFNYEFFNFLREVQAQVYYIEEQSRCLRLALERWTNMPPDLRCISGTYMPFKLPELPAYPLDLTKAAKVANDADQEIVVAVVAQESTPTKQYDPSEAGAAHTSSDSASAEEEEPIQDNRSASLQTPEGMGSY